MDTLRYFAYDCCGFYPCVASSCCSWWDGQQANSVVRVWEIPETWKGYWLCVLWKCQSPPSRRKHLSVGICMTLLSLPRVFIHQISIWCQLELKFPFFLYIIHMQSSSPSRLLIQLMDNVVEKPEPYAVSMEPMFASYLQTEFLSTSSGKKDEGHNIVLRR